MLVFSENFAYVLNEWSLKKDKIFPVLECDNNFYYFKFLSQFSFIQLNYEILLIYNKLTSKIISNYTNRVCELRDE